MFSHSHPGSAAVVAEDDTQFLAFSGIAVTFATNEASRQSIIAKSGKLENLFVDTATPQPEDGDLVLAVRVNGNDTDISITIPAGAPAGRFTNTANSEVVNAGDLVALSGTNASLQSPSAALRRWAVGFEQDSPA